jgi:virulence-associated protein VagC
MPTVTSLEALERAAAEFEVGGAQLVIEPLRQQRGHLVLDLPDASEATVPQRPIPLPDFHG